jgi:hypothetical protein
MSSFSNKTQTLHRASQIGIMFFCRLLLLACFGGAVTISSAQTKVMQSSSQLETAVFGGGCFWCLDAQFKLVPGVKSVVSGYAGGTVKNPSYEQVCSETTGHAEVIQVQFDPAVVSYEDLLGKFFHAHDPTTLNRQGPDVGVHTGRLSCIRTRIRKRSLKR